MQLILHINLVVIYQYLSKQYINTLAYSFGLGFQIKQGIVLYKNLFRFINLFVILFVSMYIFSIILVESTSGPVVPLTAHFQTERSYKVFCLFDCPILVLCNIQRIDIYNRIIL
jgi:hypothetical protein